MFKKIFSKIISVSPHIFALLFILAFTAFAWTEPTQTPPGGNVSAPLNIGSIGQSKAGGLILNTGGAANGLIVDKGKVGIGTVTPAEKLEVAGNVKADAVTVSGVGQALQWLKNIGGTLQIQNQAGTSNIVVGQDGKVGIGTMSPESILSFKMGSGTGQAQAIGKVYIATQDVSATYGVWTTLYTYTLPANSLNEDGKAIRVTAWGKIPPGSCNSALMLLFNTVQLGSHQSSWPGSITFESVIVRKNLTKIRAFTTLTAWTGSYLAVLTDYMAGITDFSVDNNIILRGTYGCGGSAIMGEGMMVEYLN